MKTKIRNYSPLIKSILLTNKQLTEDMLVSRGKIYTFLNPVSYLTALKDESLFTRFDAVMVDGSILATAIRLLYNKKIKRRSFDMTSIADLLFRHILSEKKTVYLVGAQQEQIEKAVSILLEQYPKMRIAGYRDGYFSSKEEIQEECKKTLHLNPDYVIAGMGVPLQEHFLLQLKENGYQGIGFTCGGFFSQLSIKSIQYYPQWMDRFNFRFLYRFYKEKHTRKRYLKATFLFPFYFIKNKIR